MSDNLEIRTDTGPDFGLHCAVLNWYEESRRDLPWRRTADPYAIWVSEVMLQQTQVSTVIPYWLRWMERFPTVKDLAEANEQEALSLWQGLGYYRRCRLLLEGARYVAETGIPRTVEGLKRVPGIGLYTAGAIASIAFQQPSAVVDGNVERVYSRLLDDVSAGSELRTRAWDWASRHVSPTRPGDWNQALMELGATVCTPVAPKCDSCPLRIRCSAHANGTVDTLPMRRIKPQVVTLEQTVIVPVCDGKLGLRPIPSGSWWSGMWEFPRCDRGQEPSLQELLGATREEPLVTVRHTVTNHRITIEARLAFCEQPTASLAWHEPDSLRDLPLPAPQRKIALESIAALGSS